MISFRETQYEGYKCCNQPVCDACSVPHLKTIVSWSVKKHFLSVFNVVLEISPWECLGLVLYVFHQTQGGLIRNFSCGERVPR